MTGPVSSTQPVDPIARGRQLRSNYVYNTHWLPLDFSDLLSLLWRFDQAAADNQPTLAAYYRAAWVALSKALELDETDLGHWLLAAEPPLLPSLPAFVERQAPFAEDLFARAEVTASLFELRAAVIEFGADEVDAYTAGRLATEIQDARLRKAIDDLYFETLPAHLDHLGSILLSVDRLLHEFLLSWQPCPGQTLPDLITHFGFPDPADYRERFSL